MTMPRVFVSHSHQDNAWCRPFVAALRAAGYPCFYDEDSIPGSAPWVATIQREVGACAVFLLVLSPVAWESPWVQQELQLALAKLKPLLTVVRQPTPQADGFILIHQWVQALGMEGAAAAPLALQALGRFASPSPPVVAPPVQPIPVRPAPAPAAAPDLPGEPSRLLVPRPLAALGFQARLINGVDVILAPFDRVPAGDFIMGSDSAHDPNAQANEMPQYRLFLPDFELGRYPVTVAEYACMVRAGKAKEPQKLGEVDWAKQQQHPDHPVVCVTWQEATVYAQWLAQVTGLAFRLPTEAEWEKAARGTDGRIYPWGDQWDAARANTSDGGPLTTTPVGHYASAGSRDPKGDTSPYGCHDMAGNVWEWTSSVYQEYYDPKISENDSDGTSVRVLRGGSWFNVPQVARAACRIRGVRSNWGYLGGFRVARSRAGW